MNRVRLPRWMVPIIWAALLPLVHVAMPWGLSLLTPRHGWVEGRPSVWNLLALVLVVAGLAGILWCLALHFARCPRVLELEATPRYLLVQGPYKSTRNPMYLSALAIWLGWTLFYGSVAVFIGFVVVWTVATLVAVPFEERRLEARFGDAYLRYKDTVPRWLGKARR